MDSCSLPKRMKDTLPQQKYSKLNVRTNLDITVSPTTSVQLNFMGNFSEHNRPGKVTDDIFNSIYQVPAGAFPM